MVCQCSLLSFTLLQVVKQAAIAHIFSDDPYWCLVHLKANYVFILIVIETLFEKVVPKTILGLLLDIINYNDYGRLMLIHML